MNYKVFTRTWRKENIDYPNGLEPIMKAPLKGI